MYLTIQVCSILIKCEQQRMSRLKLFVNKTEFSHGNKSQTSQQSGRQWHLRCCIIPRLQIVLYEFFNKLTPS